MLQDQFAGTTFPGVASSNPVSPGDRIIDRRHPEWRTHQLRWRFLLDCWEGGETFRQAVYGWDLQGLPIRNLIRHPHEYPDARAQNNYGVLGRPPGSDQYGQATNDPYELRRARTPVPMLLRRTMCKHLAKAFHEDAERTGPPAVEEWWKDVDGSRSSIRDWMRHTVGPYGLIFGQIDVIMDRPKPPKGVKRSDIKSQADVKKYRLDRVIAKYILPENLVWWSLDDEGHYEEVVICEPQDSGETRFVHWDPEKWARFNGRGERIDGAVHPYGRPPIERLFDLRRPRAKNVGLPRYEEICELMREAYNKASELILSDTHQAHALIQAAEEFCQAAADIPMGPNNVLPMKAILGADGRISGYQPWEVLTFPKDGIESLRENLHDTYDQADQSGCMTKPAGAKGTSGNTVAQSGVSKRLDSEDGNQVLGDLSEVFARWECQLTELYLFVAGNGKVDPEALEQISIRYPKDFDLFSPGETADLIGDYQTSLQGTGATPTADHEMMTRLYRGILKGLPDERYEAIDKEIENAIGQRSKDLSAQREAARVQATESVGENAAGLDSGPDQTSAASLAAAGAIMTGVYS